MKSALWLLSVLALTAVLVVILLGFFMPFFVRDNTVRIVSPLPSYLSLQKNNQVRLLDLWKPILESFSSDGTVVPTAKSALLFDLAADKTLYEKNPNDRYPMASLTKIMTAIIALENPKSDDAYLVHGSDLVGEDSMGLSPGEVLRQDDLLYGLMLPSGNDAAEVIATNFPGGRQAFIIAMNKKVKSLGLTDTNYTNPSGLQGDGDQFTTASDLLVITRYAIDNFPKFRTIVATFSHSIAQTNQHKSYYLENETNLLTSYPGVKGVKTGYTPEAGLCLVTYLEYKNHKIIGVILNSENRRQEMKDLLDYGLKKLAIVPPVHD